MPGAAHVTLQGETSRTADLHGTVILVDFRATMCTSCIKMMPTMVGACEKSAARGFDGVRLTPTTFLMDKRGHIVHKYLGEPDVDSLHPMLDRLLAEPA